MNRESVQSSMITSLGYEPDTSTLEIEFSSTGAVWQYYEVPENVYHEMLSGSLGQYFHANIKGQYTESPVG